MPDTQFFIDFKQKTEILWSQAVINESLYGFQIQRDTRWNPGLTDSQITDYEMKVQGRFPDDFRQMLRVMNGTDLPTLNIYGSSDLPPNTHVSVYTYPRDLQIIEYLISKIHKVKNEIIEVLSEQGYTLEPTAALIPIYSHRFIVCSMSPELSTVLSIYDTDAIVYGETLTEYLEKEFLN
jgi:hypothetical protein